MTVMVTARLRLRQFELDDAPFILQLLNEPGWKRFIGDRNITSEADARTYIETVLIASYVQHGFGLYAVYLKDPALPIGMCGLVKRDALADVDVGFALLHDYQGSGYALEAARATLQYARDVLGISRLVAITTAANGRSIDLLRRLGMGYEKNIKLSADADTLELYAIYLTG